MEAPSQRYEARIEEGKLYYDKRWYMHTIFFIWLIRSFKKKKNLNSKNGEFWTFVCCFNRIGLSIRSTKLVPYNIILSVLINDAVDFY